MVPTMVDAMDSIQITIMANTASSSRTAIITFAPTGGMGTRTDATLTITQLGTAPAAQTIVLDPTSLDDVPAAETMRTVMSYAWRWCYGLYGTCEWDRCGAELGDRHTSNGNGWNGGDNLSGKPYDFCS